MYQRLYCRLSKTTCVTYKHFIITLCGVHSLSSVTVDRPIHVHCANFLSSETYNTIRVYIYCCFIFSAVFMRLSVFVYLAVD